MFYGLYLLLNLSPEIVRGTRSDGGFLGSNTKIRLKWFSDSAHQEGSTPSRTWLFASKKALESIRGQKNLGSDIAKCCQWL